MGRFAGYDAGMRVTLLALAASLILGWTPVADTYRSEVEAFRAHRAEEIGGPGGWASLVDLHWITPGRYTIGKAATNVVVLPAPSAPARIGVLTVTKDGATLDLEAGVVATIKGQAVRTVNLAVNGPVEATVAIGKVSIALIRRGARLALRVWDEAAPARLALEGLKWVPIDPAWRLTASFTPHTPTLLVPIENVLGETIQVQNPGQVAFTVAGQTYRLEAFLESPDAKQLFFMFRDGTTNKTTYGVGRYLYTDLPRDGQVVLDFNRAMNPPCAFTSFATCPIPPAANRLTVAIAAGELIDGHH
jgi:uncharacterized protein (DUF1684 family)